MNFKRPKRAYPSWRGRRGRWDVVIWSGARQGFPLKLIFTFNSWHVRVRNGFVHQTAASIFSDNFSNGSQTFLMKHVFHLIFFFTFEFLSQFTGDGLKIIKGILGGVKGTILFFILPFILQIWRYKYRHSSLYAVNVGTQVKNRGSKNRVNRGYLVVLKGRKIG